MNVKRIILCAVAAVLIVSAAGCSSNKVGVNILEQDNSYTGDFDMPKSKDIKEVSALWILTQLRENGYKFDIATKTSSTDNSILESYRFNPYDVNAEIFRYIEGSPNLEEIRKTGKFAIKGSDGSVLQEYTAYINGSYILFFSSNKDYNGNDITEKNQALGKLFESLSLEPLSISD